VRLPGFTVDFSTRDYRKLRTKVINGHTKSALARQTGFPENVVLIMKRFDKKIAFSNI